MPLGATAVVATLRLPALPSMARSIEDRCIDSRAFPMTALVMPLVLAGRPITWCTIVVPFFVLNLVQHTDRHPQTRQAWGPSEEGCGAGEEGCGAGEEGVERDPGEGRRERRTRSTFHRR